MNTKQWVTLVVVAVVFAGGGFFGGMKYQASKTPAPAARFGGAGGAGAFAGRRLGGGAGGAGSFVSGSVLSVNGTSITVKNMAGGSQIAILAPSTQYRKAVDGSSSDVTVGSIVTITGTTNSDGSLTAQSVQIRAATSTQPSTQAK
jgi:Domain of unknown function (DUF5666)